MVVWYAARSTSVERGVRVQNDRFHRQSTGCRCVVHGDDFTFLCHGDHGEELVDKMGQCEL